MNEVFLSKRSSRRWILIAGITLAIFVVWSVSKLREGDFVWSQEDLVLRGCCGSTSPAQRTIFFDDAGVDASFEDGGISSQTLSGTAMVGRPITPIMQTEDEHVALPSTIPSPIEDRSPRSTDPVEIVFENTCSVPMELLWVDFEGGLRSYGTLAPGALRVQHTYEGHVWSYRQSVDHSETRLTATVGKGVELCGAEHALRAPSDEILRAQGRPVPQRPRTCSTGSRSSMHMRIRNECSIPVQIEWIDFDCSSRGYGTLLRGTERRQQTYAGHAWRALNQEGEVVAEYLADLDHQTFFVRCLR